MTKNPRLKMFFLYISGYFYVLFLFSFFLFFIIIFILLLKFSEQPKGAIIKLAIFSVIMIYFLFKSFLKSFFDFFFKPKIEPYGLTLDKDLYKNFYNFINEIRLKIKAPRIDVIKLDFSMNAEVIELPSFLFLGYKRYLIVGIPILFISSLEEFKAIIAHECFHLSKSDSKMASKILRIKKLFNYIIKDLTEKSGRYNFFSGFFYDYVININDLFYVMSKDNEFKADEMSLKVTDKNSAGSALIKTNYYDLLLNEFWNFIWENSKKYENPMEDVLKNMEIHFKEKANDTDFNKYLEFVLNEVPLPNTTHPTLKERLENLKSDIPSNIFYYENTLRTLFNENQINKLLNDLEELWKNSVREEWQKSYNYTTECRNKLAYLNSKINNLSEEEFIEKAMILEELKKENESIDVLKEAEKVYPENNNIKYLIGKILIRKNDKEGLKYLTNIIETDFYLTPFAAYELYNYYYFYEKDIKKSSEYFNLGASIVETNEEIKKERERFLITDRFYPLFFDYEIMSEIIENLKKYKKIKKVYMVMKITSEKLFPVYLIAIKYKSFWGATHKKIINEGVIPYQHWILPLNINKKFEYHLSEFVGGRIL
ncbi:MAG: M48 family metallopeptidase [Brevinematales bacterium]|nr:M48 family metallopeptidase [Brevinematales bacterium]